MSCSPVFLWYPQMHTTREYINGIFLPRSWNPFGLGLNEQMYSSEPLGLSVLCWHQSAPSTWVLVHSTIPVPACAK